jgi:cytochrome c nitrite reductase small subunit
MAVASLVLSAAMGVAAGIGGFTFFYAKGSAYLHDDPAACVNCHVMNEQYDNWLRSSHRSVAVCNDCHTPEGFIPKYVTKARNGWHHSVAFTSGKFHEPIQISPHNRAITEARCRSCHQAVVQAIDARHQEGQELSCIRCHPSVGHAH